MAPLLAPRARSDRAFEKLYQRHVGDVYRYALVVMRNQADAEDVTQTTFMNAYRAFARGERPQTPQNWLIAIAHNVCRQRFRQLQRRPSELPLEEEDAVQIVPDEDAPTADEIRRALSHLAFNQRAALVMRELEGRSYAEIAAVLDVSTSAVETLIFRARRALREQLEGGLTCREAEFAISRQLDGRLPRSEKGALRAHLRECEECARFARSQRAQRSAIRSLALIPIPSTLSSFFHHGSAVGGTAAAGAAGSGLAVKAALVGASAIVATGVGVEAARKTGFHPLRRPPHAAAAAKPEGPQQAALVAPHATALPAHRAAAAPAVKRALQHAAVKHGRIAAEQRTPNLEGRLRAEGPTTDRTAAKTQSKPAQRVHPAHPVQRAHPTHAANRGQLKKATHHATPKPKKHTQVTPPPPPPAPPEHEKKPKSPTQPSVSVPVSTTPVVTTPVHAKH
jgi:RNA polymerase sigma factor (sigma-70 family)